MAKRRQRGRSQASIRREHLLHVLRYLTKSKPIASYAKTLLTSSSLALKQLGESSEDAWNLVMQPWTLEVKGSSRRGQQDCIQVVMGAVIRTAGGMLTYQSIPMNVVVKPGCFAHDPPWCTRPAESPSATSTRRLHFDFDASVSKWPKNHLQIGGNAQELRTAGNYHYAVAEDPSEPRVPAPSLDLVLALDLVLREFDTNLELPQDAEWRNLVFRSEKLCLKPYFEDLLAHLGAESADLPLIEYLSQ